MATLDRQEAPLSPHTFLCKPWSSFVSLVDNPSLESNDTETLSQNQAPKLGKREMFVYGQFPALEDFCLVVCNVCKQVVTPQGILAHYEKRHSSPGPSRIPLVPMKPKAPVAAAPVAPGSGPGSGDALAFRVPKDYPHSRFSKAPLAVYPPKGARNKTCVSLPVVALEKIPCLSRVDGASRVRLTPSSSSSSSSSSASPLTPPASSSSSKLANGRGGGGFGVFGVPPSSVPRSATPPSSSQDRGRPSPARSPLDRRPPSASAPSSSASATASPLDRRPPPSPSSSQRAGATPSGLQLPAPPSLSSVSSSSSNPGSLLDRKLQNGVKASPSSSSSSSRSHKRLSGRVFDPDKHCGVQDPESKRPCTRSLTCKTHSLTSRRAVPGRAKHFDSLLAEHKGRAKEKEREKEDAQQARKDMAAAMSQETTSPSKPHCPNGRPLSTLKLRLANAHIPRVPGLISSSAAALPAAPPPAPAPNPEPSPHGWGRAAEGDNSSRLSSDDCDVETSDDAADRPACHFSTRHPRPLACCVFSSRLMGRGHYVFDRRWDRMRLALQSMVERHLNAQMWRKVPLAAESLLSLSSSAFPSPSPSATSLTPPPPLLPSPSEPFSLFSSSCGHSASSAGAFAARGGSSAPVSAAGKPRNGTVNTNKPGGRPAREREDSLPNAKKRRPTACSSSPSLSSSSSSSSPNVDGHRRNGGGCHSVFLHGRGGPATAAQGRRKGPGRGGGYPGSRGEDWLSRTDGGQSHSTQNSLELPSSTATSIPYSPSKDQTTSTHNPSGPLAYGGGGGGGGVDVKKRRSPGSYGGGKTSKLSRVGGLESLFRKGNGTGSILASGPDSPRQAKLHH